MACPGVRTDTDLLEASGDDPGAFRLLYERYAERIHRFHLSRVRDRDAALDLTAETFAQAWEGREAFRDLRDGSCGPWLFGIARNLLLRSVRERHLALAAAHRLSLALPTAMAEPVPAWLDGLDADLERALADLPEAQRRAVELRVLQDATYDDVAARLDCTPGAARIRVHRGLVALRGALATSGAAPTTITHERTTS